MREIKFRAKRIATGKWIFGTPTRDLPTRDCDGIIEDGIADTPPRPIDPATIGQYTGLKDCHDWEIYEGDIIEVVGIYKQVVVWDKIGYALMPCKDYHDKTFRIMNLQHPGEDWWDTYRDEIEVIGNIHDNPELLKGGEE